MAVMEEAAGEFFFYRHQGNFRPWALGVGLRWQDQTALPQAPCSFHLTGTLGIPQKKPCVIEPWFQGLTTQTPCCIEKTILSEPNIFTSKLWDIF